jgi:OOP family OmpA-OmpF porin
MNQILRTAAVMTAVLLSAAVAGCSGGSSSSGGGGSGSGGSANGGGTVTAGSASCRLASGRPVAMAIGARSNSAEPPDLPASVSALTSSAINAQRTVTIIRLDGDPHIVFSQALSLQGANTQRRKLNRNAYLSRINQILTGTAQPATDIRAQVPQANVLQALAVAASSVPQGGNVVLMDSGLQTTAPLDFRTGLLADDPRTVAEYLKKAGELPDLTGRGILLFGLGWTASPQQALDTSNRAKVIKIWTKIAEVAGASCVVIDEHADTQAAVPNTPPVAVVTPPPPPQPPHACAVIDLGDANNVGFEYDSTTFRDRSGARATLRKVAQVMRRTGESVRLTGATSSEGTDQYNNALSLRRADAVRGVLEQLGVPGGRIKAFGVGSHLPGRLADRGPDGKLLIGPAIQNRKVVAKLTGAGCRST